MINLLKMIGICNWNFFDAIDVRNKFPYWIGCGLSHYMVLQEAEYPCVLYEDDISPREGGRYKINIPNDLKLKAIKWNPIDNWICCGGEKGILKII
jgi:GR25 family glycosyltransferase involved in LPS biosynthesis